MDSDVLPSPTGFRGEILLIDDSPSSLLLLSSLLTDSGYRVREATSGELALWTVKAKTPDLILLDLRMPEMDGFEVCRRLKENPDSRSVPVIFLSAQDETCDKVLGLKVGAVDFIAKSSAHEEILARIDTHMTLARVKKALEIERALLEVRVEERTAQIARGEKLLRSVIDSGPDLIYAIDRESRFLLVNQNLASALGKGSPSELVGQPAVTAFPATPRPNGMDESSADDAQALTGSTVFRRLERLRLGDGQEGVFETYKTPLRDPDGNIYGVLCYRRDIAERLKMENENRALETQLWQAKKMEAIGQLAGGIAHDFNNLLSLILGFAQFATKALAAGKTDKLDDYLAEIVKAGTAGQDVVAQLLAFSRVDETTTQAVNIGALVAETAESLRPTLADDLALAVDTTAPDNSAAQVLIKAVQVQQIVTNLLFNARDALRGRGAGGRVDLACRRVSVGKREACASCHREFSGDYVLLSVADNGTGIAPEVVDKIFDPFFTTKDVGKGSGLGLPMVHGIVHSAGGHIVLSSAAGGGSRFAIYLPVAERSAQ